MSEITYCENTINVAVTTYHVGINSAVVGTKNQRRYVLPRVAQSPHLRWSPLVGNVPPSIQTEPFLQVVTLRVH
jgi:hypothetical protein